MNLAEIRKKAQKEKQATPPPPSSLEYAVDVEEPVTGGDLDDLFPVTAEPFAPQEEVADDGPGERPVYDAMALIMAGRMKAGEEEELEDAAVAEHPADNEAYQELLCFRVSTETYAINILDIKEIIKPREITEVPRVPAFVSGVLSLRGIIIPGIQHAQETRAVGHPGGDEGTDRGHQEGGRVLRGPRG
jgi:purine-binding chemotaxis protein CheW